MTDIRRIEGASAPVETKNAPAKAPAGTPDFAEVLRSKMRDSAPAAQSTDTLAPVEADVKLSVHARARLAQRGITLDDAQMQRLSSAVDLLSAKGAKTSLVLMDNAAMIVGVPARTVITAVDTAQAKQNAFTNIDSAMIA